MGQSGRRCGDRSVLSYFLPSSCLLTNYLTYLVHSCQEVLAEMVHTKDRSHAVREFLYFPNIPNSALIPSAKLYTTPQGRHSLLYPVITWSPQHFTPALINSISIMDVLQFSGKTNKKDTKAREEKARKAISPDG